MLDAGGFQTALTRGVTFIAGETDETIWWGSSERRGGGLRFDVNVDALKRGHCDSVSIMPVSKAREINLCLPFGFFAGRLISMSSDAMPGSESLLSDSASGAPLNSTSLSPPRPGFVGDTSAAWL